MNPINKKQDKGFSSFAVGLSLGVIAALLFTTDEGKKIIKELTDAIPDKCKKMPFAPPQEENLRSMPIIPVQETSHHTTYDIESPPPPPPAVSLSRPTKQDF